MSTWAKRHATSSPASPNFLFNKFLSNHRISQFLTLGVTENGAGYELGALGVPLDRAERRFVHDASKPSCAVCLAAQRVSAERLLMAGAWKTVVLAPQHGEVPMGVWMPYMQVFFKSYFHFADLLYLLVYLLHLTSFLVYIVCLRCIWLSWKLCGVEFDGRYSLERSNVFLVLLVVLQS